MKSVSICLTFLLFYLVPAVVQADYIESVEEITAGNFFGYGARQMAMGGTGLMSIDGASLFYNPANLARIPRIEFNLGMSNQKFNDESSIRNIRKVVDRNSVIPTVDIYPGRFEGYSPVSGTAKDNRSNTRINTALVTVPYPTYRGALVFGFGMARVADFDRTFKMYHRDVNGLDDIAASGSEFQSGGLYQWGFGFGVDLSPNISFGGTALLYTGKHEYNWEYNLDSANAFIYRKQTYIEDKYLGFGAKLGLAMQLSPYLGIGLAMETPVSLKVEESYNDYYYYADTAVDESESFDFVEYRVKRPFVFSAGALGRFNNAVLAADVDYTDWAQLSYGDNDLMEQENNNVKRYYKDALRFRVGGEYVFPSLGLSLRSGFFTDPLPFKEEFQNDSRYGYSFGLGVLVDQVMTIDLAWVRTTYSRNSDFLYASVYNGNPAVDHYLIIDEDVSTSRLYLTAAYRF